MQSQTRTFHQKPQAKKPPAHRALLQAAAVKRSAPVVPIVGPNGRTAWPLPSLRTQFERWRFHVPYGYWDCADGRQVIFNRRYNPLWQKYPGSPACRAVWCEWVDWTGQTFFFNDSTSPVSFYHGIPASVWRPVIKCIDEFLIGWSLPPLPPRPWARSSSRRHDYVWIEESVAQVMRQLDEILEATARS